MLAVQQKTIFYAFCVLLLLDAVRANSVVVINGSQHKVQLWCASRDDRIGGLSGKSLEKGRSLSWHFSVNFFQTTLFWCDLDWYGRQIHWDVFKASWKVSNAIWVITEDGIYDWNGNKEVNL